MLMMSRQHKEVCDLNYLGQIIVGTSKTKAIKKPLLLSIKNKIKPVTFYKLFSTFKRDAFMNHRIHFGKESIYFATAHCPAITLASECVLFGLSIF